MSANKLSVYLIKKGFEFPNEIFEEGMKELKKFSDEKCAYYRPSTPHTPKWLKDFFCLEQGDLIQADSSVILLVKRVYESETRIFALAFGLTKHLFKDDVLEEQFGLKILLNSVDANDLRKISKITIGGNQKQSQEQMPRQGNISEFGFDIDRDLIRNVTAHSKDELFNFGIIMGGEIFCSTVDRTVENVETFLDGCYKRFCEQVYVEKFEWVDKVKEVKANSIKNRLNEILLTYINSKEFINVWMAVPEVIDWNSIGFFHYVGSNNRYDDIHIEKILATFDNEHIDSIEDLKGKHIIAKSAEDQKKTLYKWNAYKCTIAEVEDGSISYCLNNGKWYEISKDFAQEVNCDYEKIQLSEVPCIPYDSKDRGKDEYNETVYNDELTKSITGAKCLHCIGEIPYGGGTGNKIEVCDVLLPDKRLMHIKRNSGSSVLSHLFNQAAVSAEALLDLSFRNEVEKRLIKNGYDDAIDKNFKSENYIIIIGIINCYNDERPKIPFFSRVSIRYIAKVIKNMGYSIQLKNILNVSQVKEVSTKKVKTKES